MHFLKLICYGKCVHSSKFERFWSVHDCNVEKVVWVETLQKEGRGKITHDLSLLFASCVCSRPTDRSYGKLKEILSVIDGSGVQEESRAMMIVPSGLYSREDEQR